VAHKCTSRGCEFSLPDSYPLPKCPWHMVPGRGPVKIAAALAVAAAGLGGGLAYKKFKTYLHEKQLRKERKKRRQRDASASEQEQKARAVRNGAAAKSRKPPRNLNVDEHQCGSSARSLSRLKLARCPHSLAPTLVTLPSMSLIPSAPLQAGHTANIFQE